MDNLIRFETAPIPMFSGRAKCPYTDIVNSLRVLDKTKSLVFVKKEMSQNNITVIRKKLEELRLGELRIARAEDKVYMWMNTNGSHK